MNVFLLQNAIETVEPERTPRVLERGEHFIDTFLWDPLQGLVSRVIHFLPAFIAAVLVFLFFWILARILRVATHKLLRLSRLDNLLHVSRTLTSLRKGLEPSEALAYLLYYAILLLGFQAAADILGLFAVRETLQGVLEYFPTILYALLIIAFGGFLASVARRAVGALLREVNSPCASILERAAEILLMVLVLTIALNTLFLKRFFEEIYL